ncbi:hypothetical protein RhiirA5_432757 [Rhizophagus irregularis]|uniref:Uncharacterized protein n=1 Tax=Rhizophagus irregularis TaxID=588596 RepID=A0A2N0NSV2_9GLOM|nr:hypothetical protein RhiirA5_432757 [Rhizophagus irregularis]
MSKIISTPFANLYIGEEESKYEAVVTAFAEFSSSTRLCNVVMDLASRPQYMQELYEEQLEVHKEMDENGAFPLKAFDNMKKLDSFIIKINWKHVDANAPASKIGKNFMPFGGDKHASGKMEERKSPTAIPSSSGIILKRGLSEI